VEIETEVVSNIKRCLTVTLANDDFKQAVVDQLQRINKDSDIKDVVASKDMVQMLEQKFDPIVCESILHELMSASFVRATGQAEFNIAGHPVFEINKTGVSHEFSYKANFEVYPVIKIPDLSTYSFTRLVAEVKDIDIDNALSVMRRQQAEWCPVDRPAQEGDSVIINCYAKVGERVFDGKEVRVELVDDDMVDGFGKSLINVSAGDQLPVEINFPVDHYQADVAGKTVIFDVDVVRIDTQLLPELDENFVKRCGIESGEIDSLRSVIRQNMDAHLQQAIRLKNTLTVFSELLKDNMADLPQSLLDDELERLTCDPCEEVDGVESFKHDIDPAMFADLAYTRIARSLLVSELANANNILLDEEEVESRVKELVSEYSQKDRIFDWFYGDEKRLAGIKSDVLGEQVADLILKETKAKKIETSYAEMMDFGIVEK